MNVFLIYILKSSLLLAVFVSLFMAFMSRETFHKINRFVLLFVVAMSLCLPFVNLGIESPFDGLAGVWQDRFANDAVATAMAEIPVVDFSLLDVETTPVMTEYEAVAQFDWAAIIAGVYLFGIALLLILQAVAYMQLFGIIIRSRRVDASIYGFDGIKLRVHDSEEKPFSWFGWIVVSSADLKDAAREILMHETAHVNAGHSWDIMFADVVILLQWFNPMAWIMKNNLKDIHEFEADEAVINSGVNAREYQLLIIKKAVGSRLYSIANSFNHSLTKKRITMMCKEKSKKWSCAKALYVLPVAAVAALAFSTVENVNASETETVLKVNEFVANDASVVDEKSSEMTGTVAVASEADEKIYSFVDEMPEFPGGKEALAKYLSENLRISVKKSAAKTVAKSESKPVNDDDKKVYQVVEKQPEFPGGMEAMMKYLSENIKYPADARAAGKGGKVFVGFVVKKDGTIGNVELMRGSGMKSLDNEALRVVASMPKWNPGMQGGKAVNVKFTIPVSFALNSQPVEEDDASAYKEVVKIVDGKLYDGDLATLDANALESVTVLTKEYVTPEMRSKYQLGDSTAVMMFTTKKAGVDNVAVMQFQDVEKKPEFPGGSEAMMKYLSENIKYPDDAKAASKGGRVFVGFVIQKDGTVANVELMRGTGTESLDNEALRVVSSMPKWNPGMQGGKAVNVKFVLPVVFACRAEVKE